MPTYLKLEFRIFFLFFFRLDLIFDSELPPLQLHSLQAVFLFCTVGGMFKLLLFWMVVVAKRGNNENLFWDHLNAVNVAFQFALQKES